ncbi:hypothetical protein ACA910_007266 [Epithemia clementina (nom. ined.)]
MSYQAVPLRASTRETQPILALPLTPSQPRRMTVRSLLQNSRSFRKLVLAGGEGNNKSSGQHGSCGDHLDEGQKESGSIVSSANLRFTSLMLPSTPKRSKSRRKLKVMVSASDLVAVATCSYNNNSSSSDSLNLNTSNHDSPSSHFVPSLCSSETSFSSEGCQREALTSPRYPQSPGVGKTPQERKRGASRDRRQLLVRQEMVRKLAIPSYWSSCTPSSASPKVAKPKITKSGKNIRKVQFAEPRDRTPIDDLLEESPPPMSFEELKDAFWSREEITTIKRKAQCLAWDYGLKKETEVATCLNLLLESCKVSISKQNQVGQQGGTSLIASGFEYLYSREILEEVEPEEKDEAKKCEEEDVNSDNMNKSEARSQPATIRTTLRGLEGLISPTLTTNRRMDCILAVLQRQTKLQHKQISLELKQEGTKKVKHELNYSSIESILAKESAKASAPARRFARMLGKVDEAVIKNDMKKATIKSTIDHAETNTKDHAETNTNES